MHGDNSKKGSGFWEALQAQHSSPLETRESLHCHCYPASQRQSLQFAKKLLLGKRKRKREEGKILGLSKPMLLIVPKIPLHYMHTLYTVPNQSILLVIWQRRKEEISFLFERRQCREVQHSRSGCYFICPWATLAAASTQVSCKYCLTGGLGPASWHIPREEKRQIKRIHDRNAKTNTSQVRSYLRSERFPHLSQLSAVGIHTDQKQLWGGRGLFSSQATVYHVGKPGKEPWSRNYSRGCRGMVLTGLLPGLHSSAFLIQPRTTCPGVALSSVGQTLINQKNVPHTCLQAYLMGAIPQLRLPFPSLGLCQLDK